MVDRACEPIVLAYSWTATLYRTVTLSLSPGVRVTVIVGPRGATNEQARANALALVAHIKA